MKKQKKEIIELYGQKKVADVFDKNRHRYAFQKYKHKIETQILTKAIKRIKKQEIKILDVGCGTGRFLPEVSNLNKNVRYFGIDTSKAMLNKLKEKSDKLNKKVFLKKADATKIPFSDNTFDVVYTFHLLWHLPKEEQKKILLEIIRVTKNKGVIIFDVLNKNFIYEKLKKWKSIEPTSGIYKLGVDDVFDIFGKRNFKIDKLNDAIIKKESSYKLFNTINKLSVFFPRYFFHMLYFTFRK